MGDAPLLPAKPTYPRSHAAAASIAIYLTIVSIVPLLNKRIMRGQTGAAPFPCPLTLTALTSCAVSAMLLTLSTAKHLCWDGGAASGRSWVFGPHLGYKLHAVAPVGLLWGFKGGVSNWGLALLDVPTHNLLMATDLVWSCAFARCINHERPHGLGLGAVAGVTSGAVLVALGAATGGLHTPELGFALFLNLLAPIIGGLSIALIRRAAQRLFHDADSPVRESVTSLEMAAIKMTVGAAAAVPIALLVEQADVFGRGAPAAAPSLARAAAPSAAPFAASVLLSSVLLVGLHVDVFWMAKLTSAVTVGIAGVVKVIPMWLVAVALSGEFEHSALSVCGALVCLLSSALWAWTRVRADAEDAGAELRMLSTVERRMF